MKSYSNCLSLSDVFHLTSYPLGLAMLLQMARFHYFLRLSNVHCTDIPRMYISIYIPAVHSSLATRAMCSRDAPYVGCVGLSLVVG